MRGTMLIFRPREHHPAVIEFDRPPTLAELKAGIGGGYLELVPAFTTIGYKGVVLDCIAMCDEDGKLKELEFNQLANAAWQRSVHRISHSDAPMRDYLVGPVIVLFGDKEFREAL